ncbi:hypothetical protein [Pedobacter psychrodurus]|uniref:hypothetical protein n=1 Tax=Pedobacter psychrodurus TaxID=2530456 RepID=UPI002930E741|nr:hypothetical protein [Pedobacter psychrodurus]
MKNIAFKISLSIIIVSLMITACKKHDYFVDGGLSGQSAAEKNMTVYDFLASRPTHDFDSLIKIINLTNSKALVNQSNITFYACPNSAVIKFQNRFNPDDRQKVRPLNKIGIDTLQKLLNRFIVTGKRISLEEAVFDGNKYYKDNQGDSLLINGISGLASPGSQVRIDADRMEYQHRKIPKIDTANFVSRIQTHNLITVNGTIHVLEPGANFAAGFKTKYIR